MGGSSVYLVRFCLFRFNSIKYECFWTYHFSVVAQVSEGGYICKPVGVVMRNSLQDAVQSCWRRVFPVIRHRKPQDSCAFNRALKSLLPLEIWSYKCRFLLLDLRMILTAIKDCTLSKDPSLQARMSSSLLSGLSFIYIVDRCFNYLHMNKDECLRIVLPVVSIERLQKRPDYSTIDQWLRTIVSVSTTR